MKRIRSSAIALGILATLSLMTATSLAQTSKEGFVNVKGGKIWYRVVGNGPGTPLLCLHGGPGVPSYYLKPLGDLANDRPVIFYDQLGCGHSDHVTDTTLWTIERFVDELTQLRQALGLKEIHLYGHSWGTILAAEYMLTKPSGIKSLILASPALSVPRWSHDAESLLTTLPDSLQQVIWKNEKAGTTDSPEYQAAVGEFYARFLARKQPWSADIDSSFAQMSQSCYVYMGGPSEFSVIGTIRNYDCTKKLKQITVPTLFTVGQFDEAPVATVKYYQSLVPGAKLVVVPNSGHLTMQDDPVGYLKTIRDFLKSVDKK